MPVRKAWATWEGSLREGKGLFRLKDGYETRFSFGSRFEESEGSNPEELLGAAHAGCFSMAFAGALGQRGFPPERISTTANVTIVKGAEGFRITEIELDTEARVPGIDEKTFLEVAEGAKKGCPVSRALAATTIKLKAKLLP
jgi:osmotically inducible protein OsmC